MCIRDRDLEVKEAIFKNFLHHSGAANRATIFVWTRHEDIREAMVNAYLEFAKSRDLKATCYAIHRLNTDIEKEKKFGTIGGTCDDDGNFNWVADVFRQPAEDPFNAKHGPLLGIAIEVTGPAAFPMFGYEAGRHQFRNVNTRDAYVELSGEKVTEHHIADFILSLGPFDELSTKQRVYDLKRNAVLGACGHLRGADFNNLKSLVRGYAEYALECLLDKFME